MLKTRVIPTLLWKTFGLVKGIGFDSWRRVGPVLPAIKVYNRRDCDELVLLDIAATDEGRPPSVDEIAELAEHCFVPFTVGGGVRSVDDVAALLRAGADKVALNTAVFEKPDVIDAASRRFGAQCVVASLDAKRVDGGRAMCFTRNGGQPTDRDVVSAAREAVDRGAGEILLCAIDHDGAMKGYDFDMIAEVADAVDVPVVASGGAGHLDDFSRAVLSSGASAVAAASLFHFTQMTPADIKTHLAAQGIPVRSGSKRANA